MLGVVLWSDTSERKAVIWCEDQGDLAYVRPQDEIFHTGDFFDAGDLVQFDMVMCQSTRRASNARLVLGKAGQSLPEILRGAAVPSGAGMADIIPFKRRAADECDERMPVPNAPEARSPATAF